MLLTYALTCLHDVVVRDSWAIDFRPGGWARARSGPLALYLRIFSEVGSVRPWLRIHAAMVTTDEPPLTEAVWHRIPLGDIARNLEIVAGVTGPGFDLTMAELARPVKIDGYSSEALERYFAETEPLPIEMHTPGLTSVDGKPVTRLPPVPDNRNRLTDEWLQAVASAYLTAVGAKMAPAPVIANAANVPVRTVHRWVAEARRRGFLPPARKGKAG